MKDLVRIEYRKLWNKISITAIAALFIISSLHTFIYLNLQWNTIDENNQIVSGLKSYRALKSASKELEGYLDGEYIKNLVKMYDVSFDKEYLDENRGYLGTGGMTKYMVPNYFINFAYYGPYMTSGNDKMGLDYNFLGSEEDFYRQYKKAVREYLVSVNEWNGIFPYSEQQIAVIDKKIDQLNTPFYIGYHQGLANVYNWFNQEYPIFFMVLAFALAAVFAKDSISGMNELTLSSMHGRKKDMNARWLAGNLFAVTAYLIFAGVILIEHGIIASMHGWQVSAQILWYYCLYNINIGTGLLIIFFGGLLGVLVISNVIMILSVKLKNTKIATILSVLLIVLLINQSATYSQVKLINPIKFGSDSLLTEYLFIGNVAVPYFIAAIILALIHIMLLFLFFRQSFKKYNLN